MAAVVDTGNSPIRVAANINGSAPPPISITTASFTAPANSLLVACLSADGSGAEGHTSTIVDSGALTWVEQVRRDWGETTDGGCSIIYTAIQATSSARTVTVTHVLGTARTFSLKCYTVTGADVAGTPVDTVGANNEGGSATNNLTTTSLTPGATGLIIACDTDWQALGAFQAGDLTQDTADYPGLISVCSGYKACTSGVGVTANLNAGGTGAAQHKWCQIIVREAGGGAPANKRLLTLGMGSLIPLWPAWWRHQRFQKKAA